MEAGSVAPLPYQNRKVPIVSLPGFQRSRRRCWPSRRCRMLPGHIFH